MSMKKMSFIKVPITRRKFLKVSSAASASLMLAPTIWPRSSWSAEGNILRVRDYADIQTLDPPFYTAFSEENVMGCIYNKLVSYKPGETFEWQLDAAESIVQVDPTHIKFTLKHGIMFTNGFGEMTAEDVKYSFERAIDPKLKATSSKEWEALDHVEITGKYSGVIVLKNPYMPIWMLTLTYANGNIISKKGAESVGGKIPIPPPCSSGPYVLKKWKPKERTRLVRNEIWKGPKPDFEEIHIFPIDDDKTAEIAFEAGDIDFTRISMSSFETFQAKPPKNSTIINRPSLYYVWLGINMEHPKLKDIRVRKAIQMAVDVQSILDAAYFGAVEPATGTVAPGVIGHREKSSLPLRGDIDGAKKLLAEAGYPEGMSLTLDILSKVTWVTAAQVIQATLAQVGIKVQINQHESGAFWTLGVEKSGERWKDVQLIMNRYASVPDPWYATAWFTSDQVGIWNWERFRSEEFDELHKKSIREPDPVKRGEMVEKMQDLMEESGCYRFITHESNPIVYRKTIIPALRPDNVPLLRYFKKA
jgi:peptide/nickel transport system substrate-binding protein